MQIHTLPVTRTARYCTLGELSGETEAVWFVCHGQGQLVPYFIPKFEPLLDGKTFIVAPEALSRYYLNGFTGRVGASWMTREERLSEIDDYVGYLNALYHHVLAGFDETRLRVNILGFSQGTATACRWVGNGAIRCNRLVLWAGFFANGLADVVDPRRLADKEVVLVYGRDDEYLRQLDLTEYEAGFRRAVPHLRVESFAGGHSIETETLLRVAGK